MSRLIPSPPSPADRHAMWVERIDETIAAVEQREKDRQPGEGRGRPPGPDR
ncbi:hypothetical protein [Streptomyces sp. ok210]|uniref:hypothetical protein n=1 Tax=Streptomyces sp. ok210 TaxID=1761905 RepID=UPI001C431AB3|nr:hypothetical protein [Streptomyces sp. ok210]